MRRWLEEEGWRRVGEVLEDPKRGWGWWREFLGEVWTAVHKLFSLNLSLYPPLSPSLSLSLSLSLPLSFSFFLCLSLPLSPYLSLSLNLSHYLGWTRTEPGHRFAPECAPSRAGAKQQNNVNKTSKTHKTWSMVSGRSWVEESELHEL